MPGAKEALAAANAVTTPTKASFGDALDTMPLERDLVAEIERTTRFYEEALAGLAALEACTDLELIFDARDEAFALRDKVGRAQRYTEPLVDEARMDGAPEVANSLQAVNNALVEGMRSIQTRLDVSGEYNELRTVVLADIWAEIEACREEMAIVSSLVVTSQVAGAQLSTAASPVSSTDPFKEYSPQVPHRSEAASRATGMLKELRGRIAPLKASVEFLPLQVDCFEMRALAISRDAVATLRENVADLKANVTDYVSDFEELDSALTRGWWDAAYKYAASLPTVQRDTHKLDRLRRYGRAIGRIHATNGSPNRPADGSQPSPITIRWPIAMSRRATIDQPATRSAGSMAVAVTSAQAEGPTVQASPLFNQEPPLGSRGSPPSSSTDFAGGASADTFKLGCVPSKTRVSINGAVPAKKSAVSRPFVSRLRPPTEIKVPPSQHLAQLSLKSQMVPPSPVPEVGYGHSRISSFASESSVSSRWSSRSRESFGDTWGMKRASLLSDVGAESGMKSSQRSRPSSAHYQEASTVGQIAQSRPTGGRQSLIALSASDLNRMRWSQQLEKSEGSHPRSKIPIFSESRRYSADDSRVHMVPTLPLPATPTTPLANNRGASFETPTARNRTFQAWAMR